MSNIPDYFLSIIARAHIQTLLVSTGMRLGVGEEGLTDLTEERAINDREALELLMTRPVEQSIALNEAHALNDRAEFYLLQMLSTIGPTGHGSLPIDFTLGTGSELWVELGIARQKAGRPAPSAIPMEAQTGRRQYL